MEWFAFLISTLAAVCCALVVWFAIQISFQSDAEPEAMIGEPEESNTADSIPDVERQRHWNFTAALIVVPTLLLALGISMQTASFRHPVTGTLAGALVLIWCMSFCSGMLSFPDPTMDAIDSPLPDFSVSNMTEVSLTKRPTETEELS